MRLHEGRVEAHGVHRAGIDLKSSQDCGASRSATDLSLNVRLSSLQIDWELRPGPSVAIPRWLIQSQQTPVIVDLDDKALEKVVAKHAQRIMAVAWRELADRHHSQWTCGETDASIQTEGHIWRCPIRCRTAWGAHLMRVRNGETECAHQV